VQSRTRLSALLFTALAATFVAVGSAAAQSRENYTEARFNALQAENALVLVEAWACFWRRDWCRGGCSPGGARGIGGGDAADLGVHAVAF
jgi:hypothetical protein